MTFENNMYIDPTIADVYRFFIKVCNFTSLYSIANDRFQINSIHNLYTIENEEALLDFLKLYIT